MNFCLLPSGSVKNNRKLPCGNSLFWDNKLNFYLHSTMSTCGQYEKSIAAWIHCIRDKSTQSPGRLPFIMIHHSPTFESSTRPTKKSCSSKNCTQLYYLPLFLLRNIGTWNMGTIHCNKLKSFLAWLTQHHTVLRASLFDYFIHYDVIKYAWVDRHLDPQKFNHDRKWGK